MSKQRTLKKEVIIKGKTWLENEDTWIKCTPSTNGIHLAYKDDIVRLTPGCFNWEEKGYTTSLSIGENSILMTEHLFSAINGLGIDSLYIEFGSTSIPFCSSSVMFTEEFIKVGLLDLEEDKNNIIVDREIMIKEDDKECIIIPSSNFSINMRVSFPEPIGDRSFFSLKLKIHTQMKYLRQDLF